MLREGDFVHFKTEHSLAVAITECCQKYRILFCTTYDWPSRHSCHI